MNNNEIYLYDNEKFSPPQFYVWCAFPASYSFGMSALGFLKVFEMIDKTEGVLSERIFTDTKTTYIQYKDVNLITFALSFELDYTGILQILEKYGIPFLSDERDESYPLIMGGGIVLSANPEPFSRFFDFIMIGDAEPRLNEIIDTLQKNKHLSKREKLLLLSKIEGIYVPILKKEAGENYKIQKVSAITTDCVSTPILTNNSFFPDTYIIEIERGCPQSCYFCLASYINTPVRFYPFEKIIQKIDEGLKYTDKIALLGALICSHPKIDDICAYIIKKAGEGRKLEVSVSSLRADYVSDIMLEMLHLCGQKTTTIAVEAGSERLRNLINKKLKQQDIYNLVDKMVYFGFLGLKMYGIIGLPTETYDDLDEFIELCNNIKKKYKGFNLIPSFSTFIPKAHTPFQFAPRENTKNLEKKSEYIKKNLAKIGVKARISSAKWDYIQTLLSRGSEVLTPYLIDVYKTGANLGNYKNIYKHYEEKKLLSSSDLTVLNEKPKNYMFPWDFIEHKKNRKLLEESYYNTVKY